MEIRLRGQYTEQDLRRAVFLSQGGWRRISRVGASVIAGLVLVSAIITLVSRPEEAGTYLWSMLLATLTLVFLSGLILGIPLLQAHQAGKCPEYQGTISGTVTDDGLELRNDQVESQLRWNTFVQHKMSDDIVLLYTSKVSFLALPRSLFAAGEDWHRFQQHIQATVPKGSQ